MERWTFGCELEIADSERDTPLPGKSTWDRNDWTIVNSNGVANDPKGVLWKFGGEINTEPTDSIDGQINVIDDVLRALHPAPVANYRSNLHIHVRVPGLAKDVALVKRAINYTHQHESRVFELVDPLPSRPKRAEFESAHHFYLAEKRWKRRGHSHHERLKPKHLERIDAATTPKQLRDAHVPSSPWAGPQYHLAQRAGINFRALWEGYETVEFRHFCLELDLVKIRNAFRWCDVFLHAALEGMPAERLIKLAQDLGPYPYQPLISPWHEDRYQQTTRHNHTAKEIRETIERWRREGTL